jgi:hypothetical protein
MERAVDHIQYRIMGQKRGRTSAGEIADERFTYRRLQLEWPQ